MSACDCLRATPLLRVKAYITVKNAVDLLCESFRCQRTVVLTVILALPLKSGFALGGRIQGRGTEGGGRKREEREYVEEDEDNLEGDKGCGRLPPSVEGRRGFDGPRGVDQLARVKVKITVKITVCCR